MRVEELKNIGPVTAKWLGDAGIHTRSDLKRAGAVLAYKILQHQRPKQATILLLYALEGALLDVPWTELSTDTKAALRSDAKGTLTVH